MINFEYKKSLGQNFIYDDNIISKIVGCIDIDSDTLVIEIGPGAASLSKKIVPMCGHAILYEIDNRLEDIIHDKLKDYHNYDLIIGDFLVQDLSNIRKQYKYKKYYVIANLPYYITTPILSKIVKEFLPDKIFVMVQVEVANRLSANYGCRDYGMISVLFNVNYDIKKVLNVGRNCFTPRPNVDSAVISFIKKDNNYNVDINKFEIFIKDAFAHKRKNLKNNLVKYDISKIDEILRRHGYSILNRAEEIPVNVFVEIVNNI